MSDSEGENLQIFIIFLCVLILFIFIGAYMEVKQFKFGHETGVILVIGIIISVIAHAVKGEGLTPEFDTHIFFEFALPMILFAAGYNMR